MSNCVTINTASAWFRAPGDGICSTCCWSFGAGDLIRWVDVNNQADGAWQSICCDPPDSIKRAVSADPLFGRDSISDSFADIFSNYVTDWDERIHPERYVYEIRDCATLGPCARMLSDEPCDCVH